MLERAYDVGGFELQARIAEKLYAAFHEHAIDVGDAEELAKIASSEPEFGSYEESLKFIKSDEGLYELDKKLEKAVAWGVEQVTTSSHRMLRNRTADSCAFYLGPDIHFGPDRRISRGNQARSVV